MSAVLYILPTAYYNVTFAGEISYTLYYSHFEEIFNRNTKNKKRMKLNPSS